LDDREGQAVLGAARRGDGDDEVGEDNGTLDKDSFAMTI
jgi:hypothetical protein